MSITIALGVASAVSALALAARYRRLPVVLENAFRDQRAFMESPCRFLPLADDDRRREHLQRTAATVQALLGCGFTVLGDLVIESDRRAPAMLRVLVDRAGTRLASIALGASQPGHVLILRSYSEDACTMTLRSDRVGVLATSPTTHRVFAARGTNAAELLHHHKPLAPESALVKFATLDDFLIRFRRDHERTIEWRAAQPPDELLATDLREFLGDRYPRWNARVARNLRHPAKATARSR